MTSYLDIMMTVSSIMLIRSGTQESLDKKKDLWQYLKKKDAGLYYKLYFGIFGRAMNHPWKGRDERFRFSRTSLPIKSWALTKNEVRYTDIIHKNTKQNTKHHINAGVLLDEHGGQNDGYA